MRLICKMFQDPKACHSDSKANVRVSILIQLEFIIFTICFIGSFQVVRYYNTPVLASGAYAHIHCGYAQEIKILAGLVS